jgi:hypothetical protein
MKMKITGILKGTGLFVGGLFIGAMMMADGDSVETVQEEPTKIVESVSKDTTNEIVKEEPKKEEPKKEEPKQIEAQVIFEDNSVKAYYYGVSGDIAKIIIENKLDIAIDVRDDTFAVNGFSTTSMTDLIIVAPKSKGVLQIELEEISGMYGTPTTISGEISVIQPDNYDDITTIKFNSINIAQ